MRHRQQTVRNIWQQSDLTTNKFGHVPNIKSIGNPHPASPHINQLCETLNDNAAVIRFISKRPQSPCFEMMTKNVHFIEILFSRVIRQWRYKNSSIFGKLMQVKKYRGILYERWSEQRYFIERAEIPKIEYRQACISPRKSRKRTPIYMNHFLLMTSPEDNYK